MIASCALKPKLLKLTEDATGYKGNDGSCFRVLPKHTDTPCISLACGTSDSTSILRFSLIYAYLRFCAFLCSVTPLSCTSPLSHASPLSSPLSHALATPFAAFPHVLALRPASLHLTQPSPVSLCISYHFPLRFSFAPQFLDSLALSLVYSPCIYLRLPQTEFSRVSPSQFRFQQAPCSSPAFPTPLHASAALVTLTQRVSNLGGHP